MEDKDKTKKQLIDELIALRKRNEELEGSFKQQSTDYYRGLFEKNKSIMLLIDPQTGNIMDANEKSCYFYGYTKEELISKKITDINTLSKSEVFEEMERAGTEKREHFLFRHRLSNGEVRDVEVYSGPVYREGRKLLYSIIHDITDKKRMEKDIAHKLKEKELLLGEIHHRVKNNLAVVTSILRMQRQNITDKKHLELFKESENRVNSMALIHEKLYRSGDMGRIDFSEYIQSLSSSLFNTYRTAAPGKMDLKMDIGDIYLGIDMAVPCGLLINELITNVLKHAFPGGSSGELYIKMHKEKDGQIGLTVKDNGVGLPNDLDIRETESLGYQLIVGLSESQLGGKMELRRGGGTEVIVRFREAEKKRI